MNDRKEVRSSILDLLSKMNREYFEGDANELFEKYPDDIIELSEHAGFEVDPDEPDKLADELNKVADKILRRYENLHLMFLVDNG